MTGPDLFGHVVPEVRRSAVISACGTYRVRLDRDMGRPGLTAFYGMVNPSRADGSCDDQTVSKLYGFSERNGIGRFIVGNKFAYMAKDVRALRTATDPVGPENDAYLEAAMLEADVHVVAWGPLSKLPPRLRTRWREVVAIADRLGCALWCFGTAADGQPLHPLTLGYARPMVPWTPPS